MREVQFYLFKLIVLQPVENLMEQANKIMITNKPQVILIILICIWLQSASILTKAFTGLLLNTYFKVKSIPIADNFEQIYQDQKLINKIPGILSQTTIQ